jgi:hypothetical protein
MGKEHATIRLNTGGLMISGSICTQETCDAFYDTFKDQFADYDGFIADYPAEFAMLYEKWNKPIIIVNCIRYEHPNSKYPAIWKRLDEFLDRYSKTGKLFFVCNNKGDQWYSNYFTGIRSTWIPSLCEYTNAKYDGQREQYVVHQRSYVPEEARYNCINLPSRYDWIDMYKNKAFIHVPYHNGSMSIFEHYTANIPMFFPSKTFAEELDRKGLMFQDLTSCRIYGLPEPADPNNPLSLRNPEILRKWIDTTDFYDPDNMPFVIYFDSWAHLNHLLRTTTMQQCREISEQMRQYNVKRKQYVYEQWAGILNTIYNINHGSIMEPKSMREVSISNTNAPEKRCAVILCGELHSYCLSYLRDNLVKPNNAHVYCFINSSNADVKEYVNETLGDSAKGAMLYSDFSDYRKLMENVIMNLNPDYNNPNRFPVARYLCSRSSAFSMMENIMAVNGVDKYDTVVLITPDTYVEPINLPRCQGNDLYATTRCGNTSCPWVMDNFLFGSYSAMKTVAQFANQFTYMRNNRWPVCPGVGSEFAYQMEIQLGLYLMSSGINMKHIRYDIPNRRGERIPKPHTDRHLSLGMGGIRFVIDKIVI